jgi:ribosomal protein S18 acetylase RimI-like enzyme
MFATATLAARIERVECSMLVELAASAAHRHAETPFLQPVGGGVALHIGVESPSNKLAGLGFGDAPDAATLDVIEQAFAARGTALQAEVSSLADPSVVRTLARRGYELIGFENVLGLALGAGATAHPSDASIEIARAEPGDTAATAAWMDAVVTGFLHADSFDGPPSHESFDREAMERILGDVFEAASFERYLARVDGEVAGGASLRLENGVAQLAGAATLPAYRRRGVQTALLRYRLGEAARRGCDVAFVTTQPGSKSTENVQRFGFSILYVRAIMVRPVVTTPDDPAPRT